jgi:prepilin-type processing-associated H-X9-DG protein
MNNWMNGVPFATLDPNSRDPSHQLFTTDSNMTAPSQLYVFIDEDAGTINDAMFVLIMNPTEGVEDLPARRHKTGYPISFADGHAETFRLINGNEDLSELRSVATRSQ